MIKNNWIKILVVIILLVAGGFALNRFYLSDRNETKENINEDLVMEVEKGKLEKTVSVTGSLEPRQEKELQFLTGGEIDKIHINEGDKVKKGEILFSQNDKEEQLNVLETERQNNTARIKTSRSEVKESTMRLEIARDNLENTDLRAPFDGIISEVNPEEGDMVNSGTTAALVMDTTGYKVELDVEENEISQIEIDQPARAIIEALDDHQLEGRVDEIGERAEKENEVVTLPVTVMLDEKTEGLKPGFTAEVDIIVGEVTDEVIVPISAIFSREGEEMVAKVEDEEIVPTPVKTGLSSDSRIVILEGLESGDKILMNSYQQAGGGSNQNEFGPPMGRGGF